MNQCKNRCCTALLALLLVCFAVPPIEISAAEKQGTWTTYKEEQYYTSDDLDVLTKYMSEQVSEYAQTIRICYESDDTSAFKTVKVQDNGEEYEYTPVWSMIYAQDDALNLNDGIVPRYTTTGGVWASTKVSSGGILIKTYYTFTIGYRQTKEQMTNANNKIREVVNHELKIGKSSGKTDYQKVKAIHDYICRSVSYDDSYSNYTEYFGLFEPYQFVCQGYALLFDKMCEEAGVASYIMSGMGYPNGSQKGEGHGWNFVKIDDKWYFIDVTWDDGENKTEKNYYHKYFLCGKDEFLKSHKPEPFFYGKDKYPNFCVCPSYEVLDFASEKYRLTISFDSMGGSVVESLKSDVEGTIDQMPESPVRQGYTFDGWYSNPDGTGDALTSSTRMGDNITYYAKWIPDSSVSYTVSFDNQDGSDIFSQEVAESGVLGSLPTPSREGYTFIGWYTQASGGEKITGNEVITGNVTYYAQWSKDVVNYTVSFDAQGGSAVPSQTVAENGKLGTLPSTGRSGYTFTGWYTQASGGEKITGNEVITGNVTYY
ncbi:InlB B-repeat-containing protein, partial [Lachnospiraceae bacterium 47-T17]